jgi:TatD DNase family protein
VIVDSHAHLNHEDLLGEADAVLERARAAGVGAVVVVGYDVPSSRQAVELAERLPNVVAVVGLHPYEAGRATDDDIRAIFELARSTRVAAIGEIGLDYHGDEFAPKALQLSLARRQMAIADELGLPAVLHLRESGLDILPLLDAYPGVRAVCHCFDGGEALMTEALARGAFISFAGNLTFKRNETLRSLSGRVPLGRLLVETDSPYLAPQGHRGRRNEPAFIVETVATLAAAQGVSAEDLALATSRNAREIFRPLRSDF